MVELRSRCQCRDQTSWPRVQGPVQVVKVTVTEELGADAFLYATPAAAGAESLLNTVVARIPGRLPLKKGEVVRLVPDADKVAVFDTDTGARLSA